MSSMTSSSSGLMTKQVIGNTYEGRAMTVLKVPRDSSAVFCVKDFCIYPLKITSSKRFTIAFNNHRSVRPPAPPSPLSSWTVASTPESGSPLLSASGSSRR